MAEVLNFEHNGITVNATESPEAMGGLGDNVIGLVGTAPNAHASIPKNAPFRINSFTTQALLDPTGYDIRGASHARLREQPLQWPCASAPTWPRSSRIWASHQTKK